MAGNPQKNAPKSGKARKRPRRKPHRNGRPPKGTPDWTPIYLEALAAGLHFGEAAKKAKVNPGTVSAKRRDDPVFRAAVHQATFISTAALEKEAARRAFHGVIKEIVRKGKVVNRIVEYSDRLLIELLRARRPKKYRTESKIEHVGKGDTALPGPVIYLPDNGRSNLETEAASTPNGEATREGQAP